jgi:hypothetical protein
MGKPSICSCSHLISHLRQEYIIVGSSVRWYRIWRNGLFREIDQNKPVGGVEVKESYRRADGGNTNIQTVRYGDVGRAIHGTRRV